MITTAAITAMIRQQLSADELAKVEELVSLYGESYDSITEAIDDARAELG